MGNLAQCQFGKKQALSSTRGWEFTITGTGPQQSSTSQTPVPEDPAGHLRAEIDVGVYDINPGIQELIGIEPETEYSSQYGDKPIPVTNPDRMIHLLSNRRDENGNCCIKTLNLITHGSSGGNRDPNGITFQNGSKDPKEMVHLTTKEDAEKFGGELKPMMCNPCQINLMGCFAGAGVVCHSINMDAGVTITESPFSSGSDQTAGMLVS